MSWGGGYRLTVEIAGNNFLFPAFIVESSAVFAPQITGGEAIAGQEITPVTIAATSTVMAPDVSSGPADIQPDTIASTAAVTAPVVSVGGVSIAPTRIESTAQIYTAVVNPGTVEISPITINSGTVVEAPTVSIAGAVSASFFAAEAAANPWYAISTQPNAWYDATADKTFIAYESYMETALVRSPVVKTFDHSANLWSKAHGIGRESVADDDHGVPSMCINGDGRLVALWGSHNDTGELRVAVSANPRDPSEFVQGGQLVGAYTYAHPVPLADGSVAVLLRKLIRPTDGNPAYPSGGYPLVMRLLTFNGSVTTIGAEIEIATFGDNSRWYQSTAYLRSDGLIHQAAARADYSDNYRNDIYVYRLSISGQTMTSFDGATVAPWPVSRATMDANFRIFEHTDPNETGLNPAFTYDANGRAHLTMHRGPRVASGGQNQATENKVFHLIGAAGAFSAPVEVAGVSSRYTGSQLVTQPGGGVDLYYANDLGLTYPRGGTVYRRRLASGAASAAFGAVETMQEPFTGRSGLSQIAAVYNADADIRALWSETRSATEATVDLVKTGNVRMMAYGDSGFKAPAAVTAPDPDAWSGQGFWIDPGDPATLFTDLAGTVQANVEDEVLLALDKSGNGNHFKGVAGKGLILKEVSGVRFLAGTSRYSPSRYLTCDGFASSSSNSDGGAVAFRYWTDLLSDFKSVLDSDSGNSTDGSSIRVGVQNGHARILFYDTNRATANVEETGLKAPRMTDHILSVARAGTAVQAWHDGMSIGTGTALANPTTKLLKFRLAAKATAALTGWMTGRIYGAIWRAGTVSQVMRERDEAWLKSRMQPVLSQPMLLDGLSPTSAFSAFRQLKSDYSGAYYTTSSAAVTAFKDQSGNSRDLTQASAALQPAIGTVNGKDVIDFAGAGQYLSGALLSDLISADDGLIIVSFLPDTIDQAGNATFFGNAVITDAAEAGDIVLFTPARMRGVQYDGAYRQTPSINIGTGAPLVVSLRKDGTKLYLRANLGAEMEVACGNLTALAYAIQLSGPASRDLDGKVGEMVTFAATPDSSTRDSIVASFMAALGVAGAVDLSAYPSSANTGPTVSLTPSSGDMVISSAGIVEALDISGSVEITVSGVTLRQCKISSAGNFAVKISDGITATIDDCEINGLGTGATTGISGTGTFRRNNIHGCENGIVVTGAASIVSGNYIHDFLSGAASPHYDGIECNGGQDGTSITGNAIICDQSQTAAININNFFAGIDGMTVDGNYISGGSYALYVDNQFSGGSIINTMVTDNAVGTGSAGYLNISGTAGVTQSGNIDVTTGLPV